MKKARVVFLLVCALLSGCAGADRKTELRSEIEQVKKEIYLYENTGNDASELKWKLIQLQSELGDLENPGK